MSFLLFLLVRDVNSGFLGFAGVPVLHLPQSWYASTLTTALGFPYPGFVSSDYFSLLPWLLLFWTGYHRTACGRRSPPCRIFACRGCPL